MLTNKYRLRTSKEIEKVFKTGKYIHGSYIFIKYTPNKEQNSRVAISISTKIFKQAVKRNRVKRLIRESLQPLLVNLPNIDILIIAKKELPADISLETMQTNILNVFNQLVPKKTPSSS